MNKRLKQEQTGRAVLDRDRYLQIQSGDGEEDYKGLEVYDSLDVAAPPPHTEYLDTHTDERETSFSGDAYSDLRYDPDWRTNLREAGRFHGNAQVLSERESDEESSVSAEIRGYRHIVDSGPAVVLTPHVSERPYRLHPQVTGHTTPAEPDRITTTNTTLHKGLRKIHEPAGDSESRAGPDHTPKTNKTHKKPDRVTEDVVERNKATLGRNTSKQGSYVSVHALKQETPRHSRKVPEALKEAGGAGSPEDQSELMWLQKTQQLRVTEISRGKKAQRKQNPGPPHHQRAPGVGVERGGGLSPPSTDRQTSSPPPNIHLSTDLLLPTSHTISPASLHGRPHRSPASEDGLTSSPGRPRKHPGPADQMLQKGLNAPLHLEGRPEQRALKWPLSCQRSPDEGPTSRTRTRTSSSSLGSYSVVPPIGGSVRGDQPEPVAGQRSSSEGNLEKQQQLRATPTYKAYSLKDYKQLKSDVTLRGLGPDYAAIEKTAEKMKRQKLYSNVVREQNKKISRIPFLPAKEPEGNDKKVPRMKALEYARTISRPPVQPQPRQRQTHLEDLDPPQLTTLELLRRRHEEEKQAVALFRKVDAV